MTGVPSAQRTVAFEKACVLFNLGALHTQIGARQERCTGDGLDASVDNFLRAASIFRFIVDNFTNAPSMDLAPQVLEALILLMIVRSSAFYPLFHIAFWPLAYISFNCFLYWRKSCDRGRRSFITYTLILIYSSFRMKSDSFLIPTYAFLNQTAWVEDYTTVHNIETHS